MLLGKVTWNSSCSWRRLLRSRTVPALKGGHMEQLMLLGKTLETSPAPWLTWNSSCSWGRLHGTSPAPWVTWNSSMLLGKVTWNRSCSWGRLPGTANTPRKDYLEQLLLLEKVTWNSSAPGAGYLEQLLLLGKVTWKSHAPSEGYLEWLLLPENVIRNSSCSWRKLPGVAPACLERGRSSRLGRREKCFLRRSVHWTPTISNHHYISRNCRRNIPILLPVVLLSRDCSSVT